MPVVNAKMKIININKDLFDRYNDLQEDYRTFLNMFFEWSCIPFTDEDGNIIYEQQLLENLNNKYNAETIEKINAYITNIGKSQSQSSSSYNIFYEDFESTGAKILPEIKEFFQSDKPFKEALLELEEKFINPLKKNNKKEIHEFLQEKLDLFNKIKKDFWEKAHAKISQNKLSKEIIRTLWKEIKPLFSNSERLAGAELRKLMKIKCKRPNDSTYCVQLFEMIRLSFKSIKEKVQLHLEDTNKLKESLELNIKQFNNETAYASFNKLKNILKQKEIGFSFNFINSCKDVIDGIDAKYNDAFIKNIMQNDEYKQLVLLLSVKTNSGFKNYRCLEKINNILDKLSKRKVYPTFCFKGKDAQIPFGNNYGRFR